MAILNDIATGLESDISKIWSEVLGLDEQVVHPRSDFVSLGGDSLSALAVSKRLLCLQAERRGEGAGKWPADGVVTGPLGARWETSFLSLPNSLDWSVSH